jgi:DNA-binding CsgD family transcriptional regulator
MQGATAEAETTALASILREAVEKTDHFVAAVDVPSRRIIAISRPVAAEFAGVDIIGRDVTEFVVGGASDALGLLTNGRLDGYELTRQVYFPSGIGDAFIWVHAVGDERPPRLAVAVADLKGVDVPGLVPQTVPHATVIGTVDDEWRIDRISADVRDLLGADPSQVAGMSVLTLVHPGDLAELFTGLGHAMTTQCGVSVRIRVRNAKNNWAWCRARVTPLGERAGFAFILSPMTIDLANHERLDDLEHRLARIAHEVHAASSIRGAGTMPALDDMPDLGKLTTREWEIVMRLRAGERIDQVAKSLHLSPSTVRNHLTAIYRKLGVRGQSELLVLLLSDRSL